MKKALIIIGLIVVIGGIYAITLAKKDKGLEVTAQKITRGTVIKKVTGSGRIQPAVEVKVSATVSGKILHIYAEEGDPVKKGQLLVQLDREQYVASLKRARSGLLAAVANEKKTRNEMSRTQQLFNQKLISQSDFEAGEASLEALKAQRQQMEASLNEAQDRLSKTQLFATMDGIVTKLNKEQGEMAIGATFQEDVIMVVSDLSVMESVIEVDENEVVNIQLGDTCDVELDAFPDSTFRGKVSKIANTAITRGRGTQEEITNFEVTVTINNADQRFRPGMSTTVDVYSKRSDDVLRIPIQAVTVREKKKLKKKPDVEDKTTDSVSVKSAADEMIEVVFVVDKDNHAKALPVKLGINDNDYYALLSGVEEGDRVVTGPYKILSKTLKNDEKVRIKQEKKNND